MTRDHDPRQPQAACDAGGQVPASIAAVQALAALRCQVEDRLAVLAAETGPFSGSLLTPREVDLGAIDLWLHYWAAILLGIALAQNAIDGQPAIAARAIPDAWTLFDAQFPEFWAAEGDPAAAGWPAAFSFTQLTPGTGAA